MAKTKDRIEDVKPYVERALKDEELRSDLMSAFAAAKEVYNELLGDRGMTGIATRVATDEDIQKNLKQAIEDLRHAADRVQGKEDHGTRNTMLLLAGLTIGILFNPMTGPATRNWLREKVLGGGDDDFTYGSNSGDGGQQGS
ncbi:MAG TPA: hypothetical protein VM290_07525 [Gaiellaceae bacterium]|nr:hypothetical protein [Gaiellaceae bacterium]